MNFAEGHTLDEKKHWVRITSACNNRCEFCLDRDTLDGSIRAYEEVVADLKLGLERGAMRAIISGGEPTIHPRFTEIVAAAAAMGYRWVQTITNGRMFFYKDFAMKSVKAGLREVTFSLHGHIPELFEKLTGAPGSFRQALTGLMNALSTTGLVVSVDIVVCAANAPFLRDIVKFYYSLGVREFDLLYPVPFGNAWANRAEMLSELETASSAVARVLPLAESLDVTFWTNRIPAAALEGFERFIQPAKKMHDEVYGRSKMFLDFLKNGAALPCRGERCGFCNMADFCRMLEEEREFASTGRGRVYIVTRENVDMLDSVDPDSVSGLVLDPPALKEYPTVRRILSSGNIKVTYRYREIPENPDTGTFPDEEVEISLDKCAAPRLLAYGVPKLSDTPVHIVLPNYAAAQDCLDNSLSIRVFFKHLEIPRAAGAVSVRNVPPCVSQTGEFAPLREIPPGLFVQGRGWNLEALTDYFITHRCYHKSCRCAGCRHFEQCPGLHVNYIRAFGFSEITGPSACSAPHE